MTMMMKASGSNKLARVVATCDGPYTCERTDNGGCTQMGSNKFFPKKGCGGNKTLSRMYRKYLLIQSWRLTSSSRPAGMDKMWSPHLVIT